MSDTGRKGATPAAGPPVISKDEIPAILPTLALIKDAVRDDQVIGVVTQKRAEEEDPAATDLHSMGTVARIVKLLKMGEDNYSLVVQGLARFRVVDLVQEAPYLKARVEAVEDKTAA